jgi:hypothetical protein
MEDDTTIMGTHMGGCDHIVKPECHLGVRLTIFILTSLELTQFLPGAIHRLQGSV